MVTGLRWQVLVKKEVGSLLPLVSTTWLTNPGKFPQKYWKKRRIFPFFATKYSTKVIVNLSC